VATAGELNRGGGAYSSPGVDPKNVVEPYVSMTATPIVRFKLKDVDPPSIVYVRPPDAMNLHVRTLLAGGDNVTFTIRMLRSDGEVDINQYIVTTGGVAGIVNFPVDLPEGYILSISTGSALAVVRGQTFASATLRHTHSLGQPDDLVLFADYISTNQLMSWPGGQISSPTDRNGNIRSITGSVPAAGAEISEVVPSATRWRLIAFRYSLTTAVAAANRESNLTLDDGALVYVSDTAGFTQVASLTFVYSFQLGVQRQAALQSNLITLASPAVFLPAGHRIRTSTTNIQAADQYTAPQYLVEEWAERG